MKQIAVTIPVVLFAYARPDHLARTVACLKENKVPLILAYADGAKGAHDAASVARVRELLRTIDWCELRLIQRERNLGLGRNVISGITEVARQHDAFIVWEDDLVCVPGTYDWVCSALRHYRGDGRVMSVTAWNHPRVVPSDIVDTPYLDGRAECWVWGTWSRAWEGMESKTALEKLRELEKRGLKPDLYGSDLPRMAKVEMSSNIWAVRWLYHHLVNGGLCLRPPRSMVEHIGFDHLATNASGATEWANPPLPSAAVIPSVWPEPSEHPQCRGLWQKAYPPQTWFSRIWKKCRKRLVRPKE